MARCCVRPHHDSATAASSKGRRTSWRVGGGQSEWMRGALRLSLFIHGQPRPALLADISPVVPPDGCDWPGEVPIAVATSLRRRPSSEGLIPLGHGFDCASCAAPASQGGLASAGMCRTTVEALDTPRSPRCARPRFYRRWARQLEKECSHFARIVGAGGVGGECARPPSTLACPWLDWSMAASNCFRPRRGGSHRLEGDGGKAPRRHADPPRPIAVSKPPFVHNLERMCLFAAGSVRLSMGLAAVRTRPSQSSAPQSES